MFGKKILGVLSVCMLFALSAYGDNEPVTLRTLWDTNTIYTASSTDYHIDTSVSNGVNTAVSNSIVKVSDEIRNPDSSIAKSIDYLISKTETNSYESTGTALKTKARFYGFRLYPEYWPHAVPNLDSRYIGISKIRISTNKKGCTVCLRVDDLTTGEEGIGKSEYYTTGSDYATNLNYTANFKSTVVIDPTHTNAFMFVDENGEVYNMNTSYVDTDKPLPEGCISQVVSDSGVTNLTHMLYSVFTMTMVRETGDATTLNGMTANEIIETATNSFVGVRSITNSNVKVALVEPTNGVSDIASLVPRVDDSLSIKGEAADSYETGSALNKKAEVPYGFGLITVEDYESEHVIFKYVINNVGEFDNNCCMWTLEGGEFTRFTYNEICTDDNWDFDKEAWAFPCPDNHSYVFMVNDFHEVSIDLDGKERKTVRSPVSMVEQAELLTDGGIAAMLKSGNFYFKEFDKDEAYSEGDVVLYDGVLYMANEDKESGEGWHEENWFTYEISMHLPNIAGSITGEETGYDAKCVPTIGAINSKYGDLLNKADGYNYRGMLKWSKEGVDFILINKREDLSKTVVSDWIAETSEGTTNSISYVAYDSTDSSFTVIFNETSYFLSLSDGEGVKAAYYAMFSNAKTDTTLTESGVAADANAVGNALTNKVTGVVLCDGYTYTMEWTQINVYDWMSAYCETDASYLFKTGYIVRATRYETDVVTNVVNGFGITQNNSRLVLNSDHTVTASITDPSSSYARNISPVAINERCSSTIAPMARADENGNVITNTYSTIDYVNSSANGLTNYVDTSLSTVKNDIDIGLTSKVDYAVDVYGEHHYLIDGDLRCEWYTRVTNNMPSYVRLVYTNNSSKVYVDHTYTYAEITNAYDEIDDLYLFTVYKYDSSSIYEMNVWRTNGAIEYMDDGETFETDPYSTYTKNLNKETLVAVFDSIATNITSATTNSLQNAVDSRVSSKCVTSITNSNVSVDAVTPKNGIVDVATLVPNKVTSLDAENAACVPTVAAVNTGLDGKADAATVECKKLAVTNKSIYGTTVVASALYSTGEGDLLSGSWITLKQDSGGDSVTVNNIKINTPFAYKNNFTDYAEVASPISGSSLKSFRLLFVTEDGTMKQGDYLSYESNPFVDTTKLDSTTAAQAAALTADAETAMAKKMSNSSVTDLSILFSTSNTVLTTNINNNIGKKLDGKSFDFSNQKGLYEAISNIVYTLGGSITNYPSFSE